MKRFRLLNKIYADLFGYFWLPCPVCGEYMGGHEWKLGGGLPDPERPGFSHGICDDCERKYLTNELRREAMSNGKSWTQASDEIMEIVYSHKHN